MSGNSRRVRKSKAYRQWRSRRWRVTKGSDYMGLFDPPNDKKLSDDYPLGTPFMLYSGDYEGVKDTRFGSQSAASVSVGPADKSSEPMMYKVWGTLAEQVAQIEPGDLPQMVKVSKLGERNVWTPVTAGGEDVPF